jgi:hypothetical protein
MVRLSYQKDIDETYAQVRESACGRQACTVLILIANEVRCCKNEQLFIDEEKLITLCSTSSISRSMRWPHVECLRSC